MIWRSLRVPAFILLSLLIAPRVQALRAESGDDTRSLQRAIVKVSLSYFTYNYENPWNPPQVGEASGTGFIISGNRILTNAHVVSGANQIMVQRPDQRRDFPARVAFIAHDCDLAALSVDDPAFFEGAATLELGGIPELNSSVAVMGFPIGGDRISVTRGIVSRRDMDRYSHSGIDFHMILQVDAAINPGNSGGPALQDGRVIGVAFQALSRGENLGYLIPTPVIGKFLRDIEDGRYDGYVEFGVSDFPTENPTLRRAIGVERHASAPDTGVLVQAIMPGSSADGILKPGDVILSVNGKPLTQSGDVDMGGGDLAPYGELLDNLEPGDPIQVEILRDGRRQSLQLPARRTPVINFMRKKYDLPPEYLIAGGLVFQPLDEDLMDAYGQQWSREGRVEILYRFGHFLPAQLYRERDVDVVLTRRLNDPVNLYSEAYVGGIVESVNGKSFRNFKEFAALIDEAARAQAIIVVRFIGQTTPLALRPADLRSSAPRVRARYGIRTDRRLHEGAAQ
ncbi:MAG: trypsin-like peptidase domain-containing protein [Leptospirales bacterium]|nr:trypsin-like peptidase domain-containing protein [Leptospirales bacterium]